jgi:hypothetical protein
VSIEVELSELAEVVARHRFAYLLTVSGEVRVHAVAVTPTVAFDGLMLEGLGRRSRANLTERPTLTLVWPPVEEGGYSLIVDGEATLTERGAKVVPHKAVLHRPATGVTPHDAPGCGADCVPVAAPLGEPERRR